MPTLVYLHGFLSSPASHKARVTEHWLQQHRPDWQFVCPYLSSYPHEAWQTLERCVTSVSNQPIYLLGSSLGGFWATCLAERFGFRSVLINPAVHPHKRFSHLVGKTLKSYHTEDSYSLGASDLAFLTELDSETVARPELYWLLVQTGDETLDYRDAVGKYALCRQTVEEGGSHAFDDFEAHLPDIIEFLQQSA